MSAIARNTASRARGARIAVDIATFALIMKVATHAGETLSNIVERKVREQETAGVFYWGYGGSACHPTNQTQRLGAMAARARSPLVLVAIETKSVHSGDAVPASAFSTDGTTWARLRPGVSVTCSRFALVCRRLDGGPRTINLADYVVGVGPSAGRRVTAYLRGRVDKVCSVRDQRATSDPWICDVAFTAEIVEPYAVFIR